jgi:hypothetical protein
MLDVCGALRPGNGCGSAAGCRHKVESNPSDSSCDFRPYRIVCRLTKINCIPRNRTLGWLRIDAGRSRKQRRTVKQMHADLVALGLDGAYGRVAAFARSWKADRQRDAQTSRRGTFVPLVFQPGEAFQFDWSEDWAIIAGKQTKLQVARTKLSHSRAQCIAQWSNIQHGSLPGTIADVHAAEIASLMPLGQPFDGFVEYTKRVSPTCLVNFERSRYSVPTSFANRPVSLRVYPDRNISQPRAGSCASMAGRKPRTRTPSLPSCRSSRASIKMARGQAHPGCRRETDRRPQADGRRRLHLRREAPRLSQTKSARFPPSLPTSRPSGVTSRMSPGPARSL